jgi:hypothetical protein
MSQWSYNQHATAPGTYIQKLCPEGDQLQKLTDECRRISQDALESGPHMRAVDKAVLAQLTHDKLVAHLHACSSCSWNRVPDRPARRSGNLLTRASRFFDTPFRGVVAVRG